LAQPPMAPIITRVTGEVGTVLFARDRGGALAWWWLHLPQ
jgi:hypothetical protein